MCNVLIIMQLVTAYMLNIYDKYKYWMRVVYLEAYTITTYVRTY